MNPSSKTSVSVTPLWSNSFFTMNFPDLRKHRGGYSIPMTPFTEDDKIDQDVLAKEIEFCIYSGADGFCSPAMVSEFEHLSEEERKIMIRVPLEVNDGRLPFIANVAAQNANFAVELAEYAEEQGADMVMAMQPSAIPLAFPKVIEYYQRIAAATTLPIMLQNAPMGPPPLSVGQIEILCREVGNITWIKQELSPQVVSIADVMDGNMQGFQGTMTGLGGLYMPYDIELGAVGTIHACQFCDVVSYLWKLFDNRETQRAYRLFYKHLRGIILELRHGFAFDKEIMVKRGIFKNHDIRTVNAPLNYQAMQEIDDFWRVYNEEILPELSLPQAARP